MQLTREWPPGYGGVERMVHAVAEGWQELGATSVSVSLRGPTKGLGMDPLPVAYARQRVVTWAWGDLLVPLPCRSLVRLLWSTEPLLVHLPCPTVLLLAVLARLLHPRRRIAALWHAFLETDRSTGPGLLLSLYQGMALSWVRSSPEPVISTSEPLCQELRRGGVRAGVLELLPCCLEARTEATAAAIWRQRQQGGLRPSRGGRVIFIGRLESYKRVDWLIEACHQIGVGHLDVVGDGSQRQTLERQALEQTTGTQNPTTVSFHGRLQESDKFALLGQSDVLVLPSASCHEAFGIVQLEAMACGVPAMSFDRERSGMAWVNNLKEGTVVPPRRAEDLGSAMQAVLNPDGYATRCEGCRQRFEEVFSRKVWRKRLQKLEL
jgi:glycosyltransferase involved in cell wall biosynthesis